MELLTGAVPPLMAMSESLACRRTFGSRSCVLRRYLLSGGATEIFNKVGTSGVNFVSRMAMIQSSARDSPTASTIYHNVQEGETLTSIARRYRTAVHSIAEANDIADIHILQAGQVLLIPLHRRVLQKMTSIIGAFEESSTSKLTSRRVPSNTLGLRSQTADRSTALSVTEVPPITALSFVKAVAPVFLLAPVFGFCARFMFDGFYSKLRLDVSKQQAEKKVWDIQHRPKLKRWQTILDEDREIEEFSFLHASQELTENETEEQRKKREFDEIRNQYSSLETTYMKFLADSGLSRSGYWRGGVPSAAQDRDTR
ncbi:hypothetical protein O6H91_20G046000 [Diphasiastrum complanatum]|uniref:Uncharacterized protein n=1 Tax=Diphasiastrum complanatum TaxID=34168 RepID=A0ACC2APY2_DIPCM|nr:hypothetical protein O6H91_20G046000 [Diphasiastrum complanatum]